MPKVANVKLDWPNPPTADPLPITVTYDVEYTPLEQKLTDAGLAYKATVQLLANDSSKELMIGHTEGHSYIGVAGVGYMPPFYYPIADPQAVPDGALLFTFPDYNLHKVAANALTRTESQTVPIPRLNLDEDPQWDVKWFFWAFTSQIRPEDDEIKARIIVNSVGIQVLPEHADSAPKTLKATL